jgi:hypothetical protein
VATNRVDELAMESGESDSRFDSTRLLNRWQHLSMRIETIILQRPLTGWIIVGTVANLVHRLTRKLQAADEDAQGTFGTG